MKPRYVDLILVIADKGSIGAAAAHLGKSQPAVSNALRRAEENPGVQLFHHVPHGTVPTDVGALVIERCRKIHVDLQKLGKGISQSKGDFVGTIDVVTSPVGEIELLPGVVRKYQRQNPNISIATTSGHSFPAFQALLNGKADYGIGPPPGAQDPGGLHSVPLF